MNLVPLHIAHVEKAYGIMIAILECEPRRVNLQVALLLLISLLPRMIRAPSEEGTG